MNLQQAPQATITYPGYVTTTKHDLEEDSNISITSTIPLQKCM